MNAIELYVGRIQIQLARNSPDKALLVKAYPPEEPDSRLTIWDEPEASILQSPMQVWVHVDFRAYRLAYTEAFPDHSLAGLVLDHILNRRVARLKGFMYLRIVPISRGANSSHGVLSERWADDYHSSPEMRAKNKSSLAVVQYADIADITKMLNMKGAVRSWITSIGHKNWWTCRMDVDDAEYLRLWQRAKRSSPFLSTFRPVARQNSDLPSNQTDKGPPA
jgi:hypothetical protein